MINSIIDNLEYSNYIAEKEFLDELSVISVKYNGILQENQQIIQELTLESFKTFITKIISNIQAAYDKFKGKAVDAIWSKIEQEYAKEFREDGSFKIDQVTENDMWILPNKIEEFIKISNGVSNEGDISDYEGTKEQYLKAHYNYFISAEDCSRSALKAIIDKNCFVPMKAGEEFSVEELTDCIEYMRKYKDLAEQISNDITNLNNSEKLFERMVTSMPQQQPTPQQANDTNAEQKESAIINVLGSCNQYIMELEISDPENPNGGSAASKVKSSLDKFIRDFFGVTSMILSLKMSTLDKGRNICMKLAVQYGKLMRARNNNTEQNNGNEEPQQQNQKTQIEK